jgi:elongation factor 3
MRNLATLTLLVLSHVLCLCSGFLDKVCTDIIHYHNRQLRRYVGNLSEFVKAVPTAKSYYELEAATLKFRFPVPGLLDGISSKEKPICKLTKVEFTYPGKHIQLVNKKAAVVIGMFKVLC